MRRKAFQDIELCLTWWGLVRLAVVLGIESVRPQEYRPTSGVNLGSVSGVMGDLAGRPTLTSLSAIGAVFSFAACPPLVFPEVRNFSFWNVLPNKPVVRFIGVRWLMHPPAVVLQLAIATPPSCTAALFGMFSWPDRQMCAFSLTDLFGETFDWWELEVCRRGSFWFSSAALACDLSVLRIRVSSASKVRNLLSVTW